MRTIASLLIILAVIFHIGSFAQTPDGGSAINNKDGKGQKQGTWKKTDKDGRLVYSGSFLNDMPVGHFTYYDTTGAVKAESDFRDNGSKAYTISFFRSGVKMSEGLYINEQRDSLWKFYNEEGILISEEVYRNGKAEGVWKTYYANKSILEEVSYRNGLKEGPWNQYYYDGPLKLSATYKNGKLEGLASFFYPNGRVMVSGPYINNLKDGVWMHLNDKGVAEKREVWSAGFLTMEEYYDKAMEKMAKEEK